VEDVAMASVRFSGGAMANITVSALSPREESYLRFDFQKATVDLTHLYSYKNADWRFSVVKNASDTSASSVYFVAWPANPAWEWPQEQRSEQTGHNRFFA
jgi:hypothetical protein